MYQYHAIVLAMLYKMLSQAVLNEEVRNKKKEQKQKTEVFDIEWTVIRDYISNKVVLFN